MTKNPRDERVWTSEDVHQDPKGYEAAKVARQSDREKAREQAAYDEDLRRFTEAFVAAGGERKDAERSFKAARNEHAARAAVQGAYAAQREAADNSRRAAFGSF